MNVQKLPDRISPASLARLQLSMPSMLRKASRVSPPQQIPTGGHAVSNNPLRFSAWPGSDFEVRAPYPAETPLSWDEVQHGRAHGLLGGDEVTDDGHGFVRGAA